MAIHVRSARPDDAAGIVGVLNPIIEARIYSALDTPLDIEAEQRFIESFPDRGILHVAVDDHGRIAGFQTLEPFATYTRAFDHVGVMGTYVDLGRHRQGIASALFAATFDVARSLGYTKIFTYVRADNDAGLATYRKQGFEVVGTAKCHARINGRYVDEVVIERFL